MPGDGFEGCARQVDRALALDLDDVRAVVPEHLRAHGPEHHLGKVDDTDAGQRQVVRFGRVHSINSRSWSWRAMDGTSGFGPDWSPGSAPCARSFCCSSLTSTSRTLTTPSSAIAGATPAASPIGMHA